MKRWLVLVISAVALAGALLPASASARTLETSWEHQRTAMVVGFQQDPDEQDAWAAWSLAGWQVEKVVRAAGQRPSTTTEEDGYFVYSSFTPASPGSPRSVYTVVWAWWPETFAAVINLSRASARFTVATATVSVWYDRDFDVDPAPEPDSETVVTVSVRGTWRGTGRVRTDHADEQTVEDDVVTTLHSTFLVRDAQCRLLVTDSSGATWMDGDYGDATLSDRQTVRTVKTAGR